MPAPDDTDNPTTAYEDLLDLPNVIAVNYDAAADVLTVLVSQKLPEDQLDETELANRHPLVDDVDTDVMDAGFGEQRDGFRTLDLQPSADELSVNPQLATQKRHRPVRGGASEIVHDGTAATGGYFPAIITDTEKTGAVWSDRVREGFAVRLSNCHVYANSGAADLGANIVQPSPYDGGRAADDTVGDLVGYAHLEDGVTADVAARSLDDLFNEDDGYVDLNQNWPNGIRRDASSLEGETVHKTGRTTGTTSGAVNRTNVSLRVTYGHGTVTLRDQLLTDHMSQGGDSGSPVFTDRGEFIGHIFAGSPRYSVVNKVRNIEYELGVHCVDWSGQLSLPEVKARVDDLKDELGLKKVII